MDLTGTFDRLRAPGKALNSENAPGGAGFFFRVSISGTPNSWMVYLMETPIIRGYLMING